MIVTGPTEFEVQPLRLTEMLVYTPAVRPVMMTCPKPFEVTVTCGCRTPFFVNVTVYDVFAIRPLSVMEPVPLHWVAFVKFTVEISGVGVMTTFTVEGAD